MTKLNRSFRTCASWLTLVGLMFGLFSPFASGMNLKAAKSNPGVKNKINLAKPDNNEKENIKKSLNASQAGFEENRGQFDKSVRFLSRRAEQSVFLTAKEAVFTMPLENSKKKSFALRMEFDRANENSIYSGLDAFAGKTSYIRGSDASKWQSDVSKFAKVKYEEIYQGVNLLWYDNEAGELEYDFVVAPRADYRQIELKFKGAKKLEINKDGDLLIHTAAGLLQQRKPFTYQAVEGDRQEIASRYELIGKNKVRFIVGDYDREKELVIDPTVVKYATFFGGTNIDYSKDVALDGSGNIYVTGYTNSTDFPTTVGAYDRTLTGQYDVYVAKFNSTGTNLIYSTLIGGSANDNFIETGNAIEVDAAGNAYVTGTTTSTNFPTVAGSYDTSKAGTQDAFVLKLNAAGNGLIFSTFLGSTAGALGHDLALDSNGNVNVTGFATGDMPVSVGAFDTTRSSQPAFYSKLNPSGGTLLYCTYISGTSSSRGYKITADSANNIYVTGYTTDANFPTTAGAFDTTFNGGVTDAFVAKFNPNGTIVYSTFLGGSDSESISGNYAIFADSNGNAYVAGSTRSSNFPTTAGAMKTTLSSFEDGFIVKLNSAGNAAMFSTLIAQDTFTGRMVYSMMLDGNNNILVSGESGFVGRISPTGSSYMNAFQMNNVGTVTALKMNAQNEIVAVCDVGSVSLPVTPDAYDATFNGGVSDLGLVRLRLVNTSINSDFDGDGKSDPAVYRGGEWHLLRSTQGQVSTQFGLPNDIPTPADFDGDGKTDLAVWRAAGPEESAFYILNSSNNTFRPESFGETGDDPTVVGDFDGDGKADAAVYRNASSGGGQSYFYYRASSNNPTRGISTVQWGVQDDVPVVGDYDGNAKMDFAVFRPSNGYWYILNNNATPTWRAEQFGLSTDKLVQADFDGDAKTDIAVFRPSNGYWYIKQSSLPVNNFQHIRIDRWGLGTDTLVPSDYDGDGKADLAVWRDGGWFIKRSSDNTLSLSTVFGTGSDRPIQSVFVH